MIHLIWSGRGFLVPAVTFGSCLLMELFTRSAFHDNNYYQQHVWPVPLALCIAGAACVGLGILFNKNQRMPSRRPAGRSRDAFFFIPLTYWGPILFALAIVAAIYIAANGKV